MADIKLGTAVPKQSIIYIGLGLLIVLLLIFAGIMPASRSLVRLDKQIDDVKYRIEEQKTLMPVYLSLKGEMEKKVEGTLPLPAKQRLAHPMIDTIPVNIATAARMSRMSLMSSVLDLKTLGAGAQFLAINVVLRGDLMKFRNFLINVGAIPYVDKVETVSIQEIPDTREYKLKIWVAIG
jgi:hypothetical protein